MDVGGERWDVEGPPSTGAAAWGWCRAGEAPHRDAGKRRGGGRRSAHCGQPFVWGGGGAAEGVGDIVGQFSAILCPVEGLPSHFLPVGGSIIALGLATPHRPRH